MIALLLVTATTMAIFGTLGYLKGAKWAFLSLLIMLGAFIAVEIFPDQIVIALNGLYLGVMLTLQGGLGDIASGDLDAAAQKLENIEPPFTGDSERFALLIVIGAAVGITLILAALMKSQPGVFGLIWGLAYGYLLAAAVLPLLFPEMAVQLPVPVIRPSTTTSPQQVAQQATSAADQLFARLSQPQSIQLLTFAIGGFIALLVLATVRRGGKSKRGKNNGEKSNGEKGNGQKS